MFIPFSYIFNKLVGSTLEYITQEGVLKPNLASSSSSFSPILTSIPTIARYPSSDFFFLLPFLHQYL
jgi:hypothetical protein